jgi:hypothetical protein
MPRRNRREPLRQPTGLPPISAQPESFRARARRLLDYRCQLCGRDRDTAGKLELKRRPDADNHPPDADPLQKHWWLCKPCHRVTTVAGDDDHRRWWRRADSLIS